MGNWALYGAFSGRDNWQQKRQDRAMNLMLSEKMEDRAQKDMKAEMEMEEGMNQYFDQMNQFDVLAEDQDRINEVEKEARRNVIKGITKFNGDLKRYMASGGISDMHDYKNNILKSDAVKNAKSNKQTYAQYVDAMRNGKFVGKGMVQVPEYDKDGNPISDKDGKIKTTQKNLSMDQQMALFKKGLISRMSLGNIEDKAKVNAFDFKKVYKDETKPWAKDNLVTERDVYSVAIQKGASEEQAKQLASSYSSGLTPETAWKYKAMNDVELMEAKAKMEVARAKAQKYRSGGSGGGNYKMTANIVARQFRNLSSGEMTEHNKGGKGTSAPINNQERKVWSEYISKAGIQGFDAHYANANEEDRKSGWGKYDLSTAEEVVPTEYVKIKNPNTGKSEPMIKARVSWDEDIAPDNIMDYMENAHNMGVVDKPYIDEDGDGDTREVVQGYVYIPIGKEIRNRQFMTGVNKKLGYHTRQHGLPPSMTNEMQREGMYQNRQNLADLMLQGGYSEEQVQEFIRLQSGF